jgi:hypothetical protein
MQSQGLLSFPLMKFSKALDVTPDVQQYNWTHATHDIVVVIDDQSPFAGTGIAPSRALKVYQGNQVLVRALSLLPCPTGFVSTNVKLLLTENRRNLPHWKKKSGKRTKSSRQCDETIWKSKVTSSPSLP